MAQEMSSAATKFYDLIGQDPEAAKLADTHGGQEGFPALVTEFIKGDSRLQHLLEAMLQPQQGNSETGE